MKNLKRILIATLIFTLSACAKNCGKTNSPSKISPLELFPEQQRLALVLNWNQLKGSPLGFKLLEKASPEVQQFSSYLETVYISSSLRKPNEEPSSLALIEGSFDEKKILDWLQQLSKEESKNLETQIWKGKTLYISPKDPEMGLSLLNTHQIIWGTLPSIKQSLEALEAKKGSLAQQKDFVVLWDQRNPNKLLWGAALLAGETASPEAALLQGVLSVLLEADYQNENLEIEVKAQNQNEAQAQDLQKLLSSYQQMLLKQTDPSLRQLLSSVQLEQQKETLLARLKLSKTQLEALSSQIQLQAPEALPSPSK